MSSGVKWTARFVTFLLAAPLFSWQAAEPKRLYVEPFATNAASEKLRAAVIAEFRKKRSISLVGEESKADAILGGGGEVWIKGYRSLNPRSGRSPANGTPIYGGYLSVELRDQNGETLWGDLVTPAEGAGDVPLDLAKRIAKHAEEAIEKGAATPRPPPLVQPATLLKGAGATFPYPVYAKWFTNYRRVNPSLKILYEPVGSEAGIRLLLSGTVDFGASDSPDAIRQLAGDDGKYLFLPSVVGAVVPIVNLPGVTAEIHFTPETLADIYLGKIKKWNDPQLARANRGVHLPDLDIVVVHRADGSGTSYAWTDFLSKMNPEWKARIGAAMSPAWPCGKAAAGNDGVAKTVKEFGGSIGYVEFIYALQNHLSVGKVRNSSKEFVEASLESLAAAAGVLAIGEDLKASIVNAPGAGAYPISSFTWLVVPAEIHDDTKRMAITGFLNWMLGPGQAQAAALGYLALPSDLVIKERTVIERIR